MRSYALTYPQLVVQAAAEGLDDDALRRLRSGHDLARDLFDGLYRRQGQPFLCHLVRVASIVLAQGEPPPVVLAALLHAGYLGDRFPGRGRRPTSDGLRREIRSAIGAQAEALIDAYTPLAGRVASEFAATVPDPAHPSPHDRALLVLLLANELEDLLDCSFAVALGPAIAKKETARRAGGVAVARGLGLSLLADELAEALAAYDRTSLPDVVVRGDRGLSTARRERTLLERLRLSWRRARRHLAG